MSEDANLVTQAEIDELMKIHDLIRVDQGEAEKGSSLVDEIRNAILDSAKLKLEEWKSLRARIKEIEDLIPHIDLIVQLKSKAQKK